MSRLSSSPMRDSSFSVKPAPEFSSSALEIQSSPPLTSSLHSRNSASSAQESAYLRQAGLLRWTRLALTVLLLGIGATVVGCDGHTLHVYNSTTLSGGFFLPLWSPNIDLRATIGILVGGAVVILTSFVYFAVALIPSPRSRTLYLNIVFAVSSLLGLFATVFAVSYSSYLSHYADPGVRDTIHSWTCKWYDGANNFNADALSIQLPFYKGISSPRGFGRLCRESEAAYGMVIAGLGVEAIATAVAIVGLSAERKISKIRKSRQTAEDEKWVNRP